MMITSAIVHLEMASRSQSSLLSERRTQPSCRWVTPSLHANSKSQHDHARSAVKLVTSSLGLQTFSDQFSNFISKEQVVTEQPMTLLPTAPPLPLLLHSVQATDSQDVDSSGHTDTSRCSSGSSAVARYYQNSDYRVPKHLIKYN